MTRREGKGALGDDPEIPGKTANRECVENVILCVARAEQVVNDIGKSLYSGDPSGYRPSQEEKGFLPDED